MVKNIWPKDQPALKIRVLAALGFLVGSKVIIIIIIIIWVSLLFVVIIIIDIEYSSTSSL